MPKDIKYKMMLQFFDCFFAYWYRNRRSLEWRFFDVAPDRAVGIYCGMQLPDPTEYRRLELAAPRTVKTSAGEFLLVDPEGLRRLVEEAFHDLSFYFRPAHLRQLAGVLEDPAASDNDKFVVGALLKNAAISAEGLLPMCQDTGTATVMGWKGERVLTGVDDNEPITRGVYDAYHKNYLRYSQLAALDMFEEKNTGSNLPAQIDIGSVAGAEYRLLCIAKGGGSANKTALFQQSKALLNPAALEKFMREKVAALGTAACPPYHLAMVVGGLSPEMNLKTLKLATTGWLDGLPESGSTEGRFFRDRYWEGKLLEAARDSRLGAQFGGKYLALDARVVRLPRHAGSCPVSIGVSCSADRNIKAKINADGLYLEKLERSPERLLPASSSAPGAARIDLNRPMSEIRAALSKLPLGALVLLDGPLAVARDSVHARLAELLAAGRPLPAWFRDHPVYYAGPAKVPPGYAEGSFGPTTAQRMDGYAREFMSRGASLVMLAKGNRSPDVAAACKDFGGFYLGTIGGAAALLAAENISSSEVLDFPELGMEAARRITVKNFPAFILCDDQGGDYYAGLLRPRPGSPKEGRHE